MRRPLTAILIVLAVLAVSPVAVPVFWDFVIVQMMVFALYATSFNLLLGYGGMLAFGHAAFYGIGAYTLGILEVKAGLGVLPSTIAAPFVAALFGALIGYFCIRLSGIYFGMLTFAFQMLIYAVALKSYDFAGGDDGLHGLVIQGPLGTAIGIYYVTLAVVTAALALLWRIVNSPFGMALRAQRNNERKSLAIGINVTFHKWLTFVIAAGFAGLAGGLSGLANQSVFPDWLDWRASAVPIVMTILGGLNSFVGPAIGAVIYVLLQTLMTGYTEFWALFMGALMIAIVMIMPTGVAGLLQRWRDA
jgi:branched-chain amino acid transport system permease protein